MGIIAVLFTLLATTMGRLFDRAKIITCASNERVIYQACLMYAADNDNTLPCPSLDWENQNCPEANQICWAMDQVSVADMQVGSLWKYMPEALSARQAVLKCPSDTTGYARTGGNVTADRNFSYSFNANIRVLGDTNATTTIKLRQVVQPGVRVLIYEEFAPNDAWCCGNGDSDDWLTGRHGGENSSSYTESPTNYQDETYRHIGKGNVCYFDGHVDMMTVSAFFASPQTHFGPLNQ